MSRLSVRNSGAQHEAEPNSESLDHDHSYFGRVGTGLLPDWFSSVVVLLAPALLAALVVASTLADGKNLHVGANTAGVAVAGVAFWRGASVIVGVVIAAVVTAGIRAL